VKLDRRKAIIATWTIESRHRASQTKLPRSSCSQRALGRRLCILPNRVLVLINELVAKGLVERRGKPLDRRAYEEPPTESGHQMLALLSQIARILDEQTCGGLRQKERARFASLLSRVAARLKFAPGVDAGYRRFVRRDRSGNQGTSTAKLDI